MKVNAILTIHANGFVVARIVASFHANKVFLESNLKYDSIDVFNTHVKVRKDLVPCIERKAV